MTSQSIEATSDLEEGSDRRWLILSVLVLAQFMVVLDVAIVNVALPTIKNDLHFSEDGLQWVITAYSIFFGGFLLLGGRLADLLGRRRLFMAGLLLFTVSSLLNGLAWSEASLIAFRCLQGLGAAMMSPAALSILTTTFEEGRERNRALHVRNRARSNHPERHDLVMGGVRRVAAAGKAVEADVARNLGLEPAFQARHHRIGHTSFILRRIHFGHAPGDEWHPAAPFGGRFLPQAALHHAIRRAGARRPLIWCIPLSANRNATSPGYAPTDLTDLRIRH